MMKKIILLVLLGVSSTLAFECRVSASAEQTKLLRILKEINEILAAAEKSISNITDIAREKAKFFIESKKIDLKDKKRIESENELCELGYLSKAFSDTFDRIECCYRKNWDAFEEKSLYGIQQVAVDLMIDLNVVCTIGDRDWITFMLGIKKTAVKTVEKNLNKVKANKYSSFLLEKAVRFCVSNALLLMENSVGRDLIGYSSVGNKYKCTSLDASVNWEMRPEC